MEKGFFHPDRGYWQTLGVPSAEMLATYPEGTVEVPLKPGADYEWRDGEWVEVEPQPPTADDVISERKRRLSLGFDYDFGDERGVHHIGTTPEDMIGWDEVTKFATALINAGDTTTTIGIVTDTGPTEVTALEWNAILIAAGEFRQPIWHASFALQQMDPIPADYADDSYWPSNG